MVLDHTVQPGDCTVVQHASSVSVYWVFGVPALKRAKELALMIVALVDNQLP